MLPLTEVCRTIRRDVRAIAQYEILARSYRCPTVKANPSLLELPDGFSKLRNSLRPKNETAKAEELALPKL